MATSATEKLDVEDGKEVEMYGYNPIHRDDDGSETEFFPPHPKKKKPFEWKLFIPLMFLCLSQAFQWGFIIKAGLMVSSPMEKAINILEQVDTPKFYDGMVNAENVLKRMDTDQFYVTWTSVETTIVPILQKSLASIVAQVDRKPFYDALDSLEKTIVPSLEKALPQLVDHIDTPEFYAAFDKLQNLVIPEIVKLLPTFDRFPKFLNETEELIRDVQGILHRFNWTRVLVDGMKGEKRDREKEVEEEEDEEVGEGQEGELEEKD